MQKYALRLGGCGWWYCSTGLDGRRHPSYPTRPPIHTSSTHRATRGWSFERTGRGGSAMQDARPKKSTKTTKRKIVRPPECSPSLSLQNSVFPSPTSRCVNSVSLLHDMLCFPVGCVPVCFNASTDALHCIAASSPSCIRTDHYNPQSCMHACMRLRRFSPIDPSFCPS
jgi:hypothetical protein